MNGRALAGRTVLVTGASSGIGEGTALALAAAGATVAVAARRAERLAGLVRRIGEAGGIASAHELDVSDEAQIRATAEALRERYGRLHGLVNNAGVMMSARVADADPGEWRAMVEVNLLGTMLVTHAVLPLLPPEEGAHVVNVSSISARLANAGSPAYAASKAAVGAFTESLRKELAPKGIRVTLVMPGIVETELFDHIRDQGTRDRFAALKNTLDPLQPADIGNAVVFALAQPPHVSINELIIRPTKQVE